MLSPHLVGKALETIQHGIDEIGTGQKMKRPVICSSRYYENPMSLVPKAQIVVVGGTAALDLGQSIRRVLKFACYHSPNAAEANAIGAALAPIYY